MKKSIITIAQQSKISWHPLTASLYKTLIDCYDDDFIRHLTESYPNQHRHIPQVVFFTHDSTIVKANKKKHEINSKVNNYQIVAGVFNPWFDESCLKNKQSDTTFICLSTDGNTEKQAFEQQIVAFILGDFFKTIGTANMRFIGNSFFGLMSLADETVDKALINQFFMAFTEEKLTADNYAKLLMMTRIALYKQAEAMKKHNIKVTSF